MEGLRFSDCSLIIAISSQSCLPFCHHTRMKYLKKTLTILLSGFGALFIVLIALAFTDVPYYAYHDLAVRNDTLTTAPDYIVIMGGDGMPSPQGLMRLYHGAEVAKEDTLAQVIIALPYNQDEKDSLRQIRMMKDELILKGIKSSRILYEPWGYNTRTQAVQVSKMIPLSSSVLIISSPEHMYRALNSFRKVGFEKVGGRAGFEVPSDEKMLKTQSPNEDDKMQNLNLRYNLWSYLQYEIIVGREYAAIAYYWWKDWI